ncbi:MAG: hypothetical protein E5Y12_09440 [Mesorhizobium sp.]|nr:MAG: hypothetical protein E5Y12_09440 [Mesorhizobium sp.]
MPNWPQIRRKVRRGRKPGRVVTATRSSALDAWCERTGKPRRPGVRRGYLDRFLGFFKSKRCLIPADGYYERTVSLADKK